MRRNRFLRVAVVALLLAGIGRQTLAGDLTLVREQDGRHAAYTATTSGFHRLPIESHLNTVELGGSLCRVDTGREQYLLGSTEAGVVIRRIDKELGGHVQSFTVGERLALASGRGGLAVYGLSRDAVVARFFPEHISTARLSGNIAYLQTTRGHMLLAPGDDGIMMLDLGQANPAEVRLARNQAATSWTNGVFLHVPVGREFRTVQLSQYGAPIQVLLGNALAGTDHPVRQQDAVQPMVP